MAKSEIRNVSVENRSAGPLAFQTPSGVEIPEEFQNLSFGDPVDRGRKSEDGGPLPQPEITMPAPVWLAYEEEYPEVIQDMIESQDLVVRL
jgi:hypothetical protein